MGSTLQQHAQGIQVQVCNLKPDELIAAAINMHGSPRQAEQLITAPQYH